MPTARRLDDASALRALAHPLRQQIYELLVLAGPLTATEVGRRVDESPANCSWHLRKLAEHGFVEEAEGGSGRQRPWRATATALTWGEGEADPELDRAGTAALRMVLDRERSRLDSSLERVRADAPQWHRASEVHQALLWLTAEELDEVRQVLGRLAAEHAERLTDPDQRPAGARLCAYVAWAVPAYDLPDLTPGDAR